MRLQSAVFGLCAVFSVASGANFYDRDENVLELTPSTFDKVVHRTNYTTLVEFYAPWCGYCQELKRPMRSAAKMLSGMVQVAAVNCDESVNKQLCAQHRVSGFPTLMVFRPPKVDLANPNRNKKAASQHASEVYKGQRRTKPIVDFAVSRVKNYVKRLNRYSKFEEVLQAEHSRYAVVLLSKKEKIPTVFKAVALDWLGMYEFYSIWDQKLDNIDQLTVDAGDARWPNVLRRLRALSQETPLENARIAVIDKASDAYHELELRKGVDKADIAEFLAQFEQEPREGPLSKRQEYLQSVASGRGKKGKARSRPRPKDEATAESLVQDEL